MYHPLDEDKRKPVLTADFIARDMESEDITSHAPKGCLTAGLIALVVGFNVIFTFIALLAMEDYPIVRNILLVLFWGFGAFILGLHIWLNSGPSAADSICRGKYHIVTLPLKSLTREEVEGHGSSDVYRDVYWFDELAPYKEISTPGRMLRAAEGDVYHIVVWNSRPGYPVRIYPADSYDLPEKHPD